MKFVKILLIVFTGVLHACNSKSINKKNKIISTKSVVPKSEETINEKKIKRGEKIKLYVYEEHSVFDLLFDTISPTDFKKYYRKDVPSKVKIRRTPKMIDIPTAAQTHQLIQYNSNKTQLGNKGYEFINYFQKPKLYALNQYFKTDMGDFSYLVLIDSITDYQYEIESIGDNALEAPVFSTKNSYIATFRNNIYEDNSSTIAIIKINDKEHPKSYLTVKSVFTTYDFNIESIYWKNDHTLYLKCFRIFEIEEETKKDVFYLKTKIE